MLSKFSAIFTLDVKHWSISTLKWLQTKLNLQNKNQEDSEPGENHARGQRPPEAVVIRPCLPLMCSVRLSSWKCSRGLKMKILAHLSCDAMELGCLCYGSPLILVFCDFQNYSGESFKTPLVSYPILSSLNHQSLGEFFATHKPHRACLIFRLPSCQQFPSVFYGLCE